MGGQLPGRPGEWLCLTGVAEGADASVRRGPWHVCEAVGGMLGVPFCFVANVAWLQCTGWDKQDAETPVVWPAS